VKPLSRESFKLPNLAHKPWTYPRQRVATALKLPRKKKFYAGGKEGGSVKKAANRGEVEKRGAFARDSLWGSVGGIKDTRKERKLMNRATGGGVLG